ncbi:MULTISPECIES: UvrD-helicase domain-containing protein [Psychrobacter]|jgi:exodeoxyribonuclease V beta subunit|uniref:RecBCD enzyme subunit RecB n=1 Tax=Psychrobacter pocilloporae TaxID=1775882 RepID=A0ABT6ISI4_9GAMM|nr:MULTISPECIES: UvrD-helicase domain-containing protein [Psychrobacter]MDH4904799.1 exodeoxyribonuclease V subunit beta [Psychrobacter pocilloporae]|tara:strand:- start:16216 stop:20730 length:4515 start_codon:yes stop_codon:yes gene_type:complete
MTDFTDTTDIIEPTVQPNLSDDHPDVSGDLGAIVEEKEEIAPAVAVALTGRHLIEASAGTGKTWTLTGIVLRLLIEARRAPEQIIATTFTRAAAAEMRQRIHDRLVEFYQLLQWVNNLSADTKNKDNLYPNILQVLPDRGDNKNNKDKPTSNDSSIESNAKTEADEFNQDIDHDHKHAQQVAREKRAQVKKAREDWLKEQAKHARLNAIMDDPINLHLVGYLLDHVYSYPMAEAIRRTALVLTTLDKLFVGTLDSLAQKWLTEYSSETGHQQGMAIIEDSSIEQVTDSIIHDELRQFQSRLYHEQPKLYALMDQQGKLTAVGDHKKFVSRSLNFISAPIDEMRAIEFDIQNYEEFLNQFCNFDFNDIQTYLDKDFRKKEGFDNRKSVAKNLGFYQDFKDLIQNKQLSFSQSLSKPQLNFLKQLKATYDDSEESGFLADKEQGRVRFISTKSVQMMLKLYKYIQQFNSYIITILANLNRHIVLAVRNRLPVILEERGETTFSLQMVRLNQALTGRQGDKLARYIRHHYPIALIDESQDINGEQAIMIESIYLPKRKRKQSDNDKQSTTKKSSHEFLLLVGDPKQAIYGFRGGDVTNYNYMKGQFDKSTIWTLNTNRRSNAGVIHALNCWFGMPTATTADNKLAQLGSDIYYQHTKARKEKEGEEAKSKLSWFRDSDAKDSSLVTEVLSAQPVSILHLPNGKDGELDYDEYEITARHIASLLSSGQTLKDRPIQPSDIGVLARTKKDLKQVEDELVKLGVPTLTTSDVSIFETIMAEDVAALLSAMLYPYRHDMINRVLTSHLYGLSINDIKAMMTDHESGVAESDDRLNSINLNSSDVQNTEHKKSYQDFITYLKEGAQRWQHFGVLSALHYLLDKSPIQTQGVWQALAAHPDGDRHIMDLRHIMDVLAQYGLSMGEHELLAWFRQHIEAAPNSDWAKQYPLPTESGVQLMTIHKSKGLEFPIVYVLGMGDASRKSGNNEKYGLYLYNAQQAPSALVQQSAKDQFIGNQRRFSPLQGSATVEDYYTDIETKEGFDELRRLGYVAFTRASEQLYIVLRDPSNKTGFELKPVFYWFDSPDAKFELPDRLKGTIGMLRGHNINEFYNSHYTKTVTSTDTKLTIEPTTQAIEYVPFAEVMKTSYFYGWAKTSFTALARQLDESTQAMAVVDERIDDAIDIDMADAAMSLEPYPNSSLDSNTSLEKIDELSLKSEEDIRFTFVKGANAGTFLHEIFEKIDFTNKSQWSGVIDRAVSSYQLPLMYSSAEHQSRRAQGNREESSVSFNADAIDTTKHEALIAWIEEVLRTPLLASNQPLYSLNEEQRFAELEFNMGLSERFKAEDISQLFQQYLPDETDKHVNLVPQNRTHLYRYLRGEIDLVYEYAGKYYVVDYKSNFLGNSLSDYNENTLRKAMTKAGYWLQAAIYQVALHRFLSMRIADYVGNESRYLGAVEYVFLRGVYSPDAQATATVSQEAIKTSESPHNGRYGLVTWDIPIDFIKGLDALFGVPD